MCLFLFHSPIIALWRCDGLEKYRWKLGREGSYTALGF